MSQIKYENYIIIYNNLLKESEHKLTVDEFYFYVLLVQRISSFKRVLEISLNHIFKVQNLHSVKDNNKKKSMDKIRSNINSLVDKKVLSVNVDILEVGYDTFFEVRQLHLEDSGYERLYESTYDLCDNRYALYIICFMNQFKIKQIEKSLDNWVTTMRNVSKNTVIKYLNQLCDEEKLFKKEGVKKFENNKVTERPMIYSLTPFNGLDTKSNTETPAVTSNVSTVSLNPSETHVVDEPSVNVDDATDTITVDDTVTSTSPEMSVETCDTLDSGISTIDDNSVSEDILVAESVNYGNWIIHGANLTDEDYDLYAAHEKDNEFTKVVDKKINIISKNKTNEKVIEMYEKHLQAARDRISAKHREDRYALVDKHKQQVIANHLTGKYITLANNNRAEDECHMASMLIDDFAKLSVAELKKISDIYKFTEGEHGKYVDHAESFFSTMQYAEEGLIGSHDVKYTDIAIKQIRDEIVNQMRSDKYAEDGYELDLYNLKKYKASLIKPVAANNTNKKSKKTVNETDISGHLESSSVKEKVAADVKLERIKQITSKLSSNIKHDNRLPF